MGTGLVRAEVESAIEVADAGRHNAAIEFDLRVATPRTAIGRVHFDATLLNRYHDYLNAAPVALGGDTRLRGYPSQRFVGNDLLAGNVEYRTNSIDVLSAQLGGVVFYDVGDAFFRFQDADLKQSAGLGLRILFPQADRLVLRGDYGFPLTRGFSTLPGAWFVTFGQAFGMPGIVQPSVVTSTFIN
jgi:outer membrane translocation and assembly module TamA